MALAQRAFGTRPQTDPWGNPAGSDSYEEWYAQELARQKQEALMSQVQRQQPYYGPEGYTPGGVGPGGLGANNYPSGGTAVPPAFGSYFQGWGENPAPPTGPEGSLKRPMPEPSLPHKVAMSRLDQHMEAMKKGMAPKEAIPEGEKAIEVTRPVVVQASAVRTATQARDVLRKADKNTIVLDGMSDFGFLSDKVIIVPGAGGEALDPQRVLEATSPPVLTQGMAAKMLKYLASVVPDKPESKKKTEGKESPPWWTLPYQAYTYQGPENKIPGIMGKIHGLIDPVKAMGGYGGVVGAVMMPAGADWQRLNVAGRGQGIQAWHGSPNAKLTALKAQQSSGAPLPGVSVTVDPSEAQYYANYDIRNNPANGKVYPVTIKGTEQQFPDILDLANQYEAATGKEWAVNTAHVIKWAKSKGYLGYYNPHEGMSEYLVFDPSDLVMGHAKP